MKLNEHEIFEKCLENLRDFQPIQAVKVQKELKKVVEKGVDAFVEVQVKRGRYQYGVEIKTLLKRPLPAYLYDIVQSQKGAVIVMSGYINSSIAGDLKRAGIQYIDVAGNAFLKIGDEIHVEVAGKRPADTLKPEVSSLFQPKLMQLLAIILIDPVSVNQTVRVLAERAGLSKDRVSVGLRLLKERGWLLPAGKKTMKLVQRQTLFEQWLMNYGERLRPKLVKGTYKIAPSVEQNLEARLAEIYTYQAGQFAYTGSAGADQLIHYYRGQTTEIFVAPKMLDRLCKTFRLIPSRESDVTLFDLFSPEIIWEGGNCAHPLFIYAELMYHGGDRENETARMIYDQFLRNMLI